VSARAADGRDAGPKSIDLCAAAVPINTFVAYTGPADLESATGQAGGGLSRSPLTPLGRSLVD
jgi:hypothetical protein